jgi:glutamine amidotransferase
MAATVAIIDYGSGNLRSAEKAFARVAGELGSGHEIVVTPDPERVRGAERIVLPGVGAFADCMRGLSAVPGMVEVLEDAVISGGKPFLGICVGMQLLAKYGREHGDHKGLGWLDGDVVHLTPCDPELKIPHMGWNELRVVQPHPLLAGLPEHAHAYFVHSYQFLSRNRELVLATTDYAGEIAAVVGRDNIAGTQFHPEKSQEVGLGLIANFLAWRP